MIELDKDIRDIQFELNEIDQITTGTKTASFNDLLELLDNRNGEITNLKEKNEELEADIEENYRPITREEELL